MTSLLEKQEMKSAEEQRQWIYTQLKIHADQQFITIGDKSVQRVEVYKPSDGKPAYIQKLHLQELQTIH